MAELERQLAAVIVALQGKMLTPELRAHIPPEIRPYLEQAIAGDEEARKVLVGWLERHGDKTVIQ